MVLRIHTLIPLAVLTLGPALPAEEVPTFADDVAPIIHAQCSECHREGEAAPFPLTTYEEVRKRGRMVRDVTSDEYMPPWMPREGHGDFKETRRLSDKEIATLDAWFEGGMPRGDATREPAPPEFVEGWRLGEPDLVLEMAEPYLVKAEGKDVYRWFVLATNLKQERFIKAIEIRAAAPEVLHHALFFHDNASGAARKEDARDETPGFKRRVGRTESLGGWAVGSDPVQLPGDLAYPIPAGADFLLQVHFHPNGKPQEEKLRIGIHFQDAAPEKPVLQFQVPPQYGAMTGLDIPPGEKDYRIEDHFTVPEDIVVYGVWGHAHQICTSIRADATLPDGTRKPLIYLDEWDFNWQGQYQYVEPIELPKGTVVDAVITYDNSASNPNNPNSPPQRIIWGEQSDDEMGSAIFLATAKEESRSRAFRVGAFKEAGESRQRFDVGRRVSRVMKLDKNGDGKVALAEVPLIYRGAFKKLDQDVDGFVVPEEVREHGGFLK